MHHPPDPLPAPADLPPLRRSRARARLVALLAVLSAPGLAQRDGWEDALRVPRAGLTLLPLPGWSFEQYPALPASAVQPAEEPPPGEVLGGAVILAGGRDRMRLSVQRIAPGASAEAEALRRLAPAGDARPVPPGRKLFAPFGAASAGAASTVDKERGLLRYCGVAAREGEPWILVEGSAPLRDRAMAEELRRQLAAVDLTPFDAPDRHVDFKEGWTIDVPSSWRIDREPDGAVVLRHPETGWIVPPTVRVVQGRDLEWLEPRARRVTEEYDRKARAAIPEMAPDAWLPSTKESLRLAGGAEARYLIVNFRSPIKGSPRYDVLITGRFELVAAAPSDREDLFDPVSRVLRTFRPLRDPGGYRDR